MELLANYNFEVLYKKGLENGRADALSRRPDHVQDKPEQSRAIFDIGNEERWVYNRPSINAITLTEDESELKEIRTAYAKDTGAQRILGNPKEHESC